MMSNAGRIFQQYAQMHADELISLTCELTQIPALSNYESQRAAFCAHWLEAHGAKGVYIDGVGNLVWPFRRGTSGKWIILSAHMDTVFELDVPLEIHREDKKLYCPGIGDDTANLAVLLFGARWCIENAPQTGEYGLMFVGTVGEEIGSKGVCRLIDDIGSEKIYRFYSFDATFQRLYVGVVNYQNVNITVKTPGGHSLGAFGVPNAIEELADLLNDLAKKCRTMIAEKELKRTTFNAGIIRGGKRHNQIADHAELLVEFRSDMQENFDEMLRILEDVCIAHRKENVKVTVEMQGAAPLWGTVDEALMGKLEHEHLALMNRLGFSPRISKSATDCRYPMHKGIPSLCLGLCLAYNPHTTEEYLMMDSLEPGLELLLTILKHIT